MSTRVSAFDQRYLDAVFFVRRSLWLPSWPLLVGLLLVFLLPGYWGATRAAYFLALNDPVGEGVLVVEGWLDDPHLLRAIDAYRSGGYQMLITTGGPTLGGCDRFDSYAISAYERLKELGLVDDAVYALPSPESKTDRTWQDAITVRDWLARHGIRPGAIDVFTGHVHARRSRDLYQEAFADQLRVGVLSSPALRFDYGNWWATSEGAKTTGIELIAWLHIWLLGNRG